MKTSATKYTEELFSDNYPPGVEDHYWSRARNWVLHRTLRIAERKGIRNPSADILEIGCGPGVVVDYLFQRGFPIRGVELGTPQPIQRAHKRITTGIPAQELPETERRAVDTIMLLDVIEHIEDDREFLKTIRSAFPNCRCIIVTVPARPEAWSEWDEYYGHFRRYSPETLRKTLSAIGGCVYVRYFFRLLYLAARLISAAGQARSVQMNSPHNMLLHRTIAAILKAETLLTPRFPIPGLSLVAICDVHSERAQTLREAKRNN